jgi:hypothetical protein
MSATNAYDRDCQGHVNLTHEGGQVDTYYLDSESETQAAKVAMRAAGLVALPVYRGAGADEVRTASVLFAGGEDVEDDDDVDWVYDHDTGSTRAVRPGGAPAAIYNRRW